MKTKSYLSALLVQARQQLGFTQKELAQRLNIPNSRLCRYEKGNRMPSMQVLNKLKTMLGGSVDDTLITVVNNREKF